MLENELYAPVAAWATRTLGCVHTGIEKGLRLGRIDVAGFRDSGGRLSGRAEVIAIEVKRGSQPFATSAGQAHGYSIYADRCYLAEYRPGGFNEDERAIAAHLGIGLIAISGQHRLRIQEIVTAPPSEPMEGLRLEIVEKLDHSLCTVCGCFFRRGEPRKWDSHVVRQGTKTSRIERAAEASKGFVYWLSEAGGRMKSNTELNYHRRYVCSDCIQALFSR